MAAAFAAQVESAALTSRIRSLASDFFTAACCCCVVMTTSSHRTYAPARFLLLSFCTACFRVSALLRRASAHWRHASSTAAEVRDEKAASARAILPDISARNAATACHSRKAASRYFPKTTPRTAARWRCRRFAAPVHACKTSRILTLECLPLMRSKTRRNAALCAAAANQTRRARRRTKCREWPTAAASIRRLSRRAAAPRLHAHTLRRCRTMAYATRARVFPSRARRRRTTTARHPAHAASTCLTPQNMAAFPMAARIRTTSAAFCLHPRKDCAANLHVAYRTASRALALARTLRWNEANAARDEEEKKKRSARSPANRWSWTSAHDASHWVNARPLSRRYHRWKHCRLACLRR
mmetsp:Transcript_16814/g.41417  ORF Transcript_16814/g.41417 Transcript_16814/m.41417 type:complete len:356 (-) Transcript_16814:2910-3977(-)